MSYIRCLSNPERLYVWSNGKYVNITHSVKRPNSSGRHFTIPHGIFEGTCKRWANDNEPAVCRGAKAEELHIDRTTGRVIPEWKPCTRGCKPDGKNTWTPCLRCLKKSMGDAKRGEFVIRLSYKKDFVNMWRVTWEYIISRFRTKR